MQELTLLKENNLALENAWTASDSNELGLIQGADVIDKTTGENNSKLAKLTPKNEREFYRKQGYDPKGKTAIELQKDLSLPTILESPINYDTFSNSHVKALYLEDGTLLDVVHEKWQVIQPLEVMSMFLDYCEEAKLEVEKVGVFKYERSKENDQNLTDIKQTYSLWFSAKLNEDYEVTEGDKLTGKLFFKCPYINGHGYSIGVNALRQACSNGVYIPVRLKSKNIGHIGGLKQKQIQETLVASKKLWRKDREKNLLFADTECTEQEAIMLLVSCFSTVKEHQEIAAQALYEVKHGGSIDAVASIFFSSKWDKECAMVRDCIEMYRKGLWTGYTQGTKGTMWGLLNSVTEYVNWNGKQKDSTLSSLLGGSKALKITKFSNSVTDLTNIKRARVEQRVSVTV